MSAKKNSEKKKTSQIVRETLEMEKQSEVEKLQQELKDKQEKLLRAYADHQNYQKRMEKEWSNNEDELKKRYLIELLDVYEIIQKAVQDNDPKPGLKLVLQNMEKFFDQEHIKYIDCTGKPFDPLVHHAITTVDRNDCCDETIVEEVKKGYFLGDKLLRPSQVIVAKKKDNQNKEVE